MKKTRTITTTTKKKQRERSASFRSAQQVSLEATSEMSSGNPEEVSPGVILKELLLLAPIPEAHELKKRLSPKAWHEARELLLVKILANEGPGDNLVEHLKQRPLDYNPKFLETYLQSREHLDELIASVTKDDVQASVDHFEQRIDEEKAQERPSKKLIANLKTALAAAKGELEAFDGDPVRLHAVARHHHKRKQRGQQEAS
jgi:hypothetical protein